MNKFGLMSGALLLLSSTSFAQMEKSIRLNEVQTSNTAGLVDEYGQREAWVEIANVSYSTYNIRGMYITTDRSVLDKKMSVPERVKRMHIVPSGDGRTNLSARQHIVFHCNSQPEKGSLHLAVPVDSQNPVWIALYNGNGVNLVDSVTVPALADNQVYARVKDGAATWTVRNAEEATPGISNDTAPGESKIAKLKREDPYGIGITVLSMGIVFFCLALMFLFFHLFGLFMRHREMAGKVAGLQPLKAGVKTVEKTVEIGHIANNILQDGLQTKGIDKEIYMAVIAMALKQYQEEVHDIESGVITIKPKDTDWNGEYMQMTQFHE
jgi:hypothetical protein